MFSWFCWWSIMIVSAFSRLLLLICVSCCCCWISCSFVCGCWDPVCRLKTCWWQYKMHSLARTHMHAHTHSCTPIQTIFLFLGTMMKEKWKKYFCDENSDSGRWSCFSTHQQWLIKNCLEFGSGLVHQMRKRTWENLRKKERKLFDRLFRNLIFLFLKQCWISICKFLQL